VEVICHRPWDDPHGMAPQVKASFSVEKADALLSMKEKDIACINELMNIKRSEPSAECR
jgi:hypothetical protein